jgi:hypothetical protein
MPRDERRVKPAASMTSLAWPVGASSWSALSRKRSYPNLRYAPAFFSAPGYQEAGLFREETELLVRIRYSNITGAQLRSLLELSPEALKLSDLVRPAARPETRRRKPGGRSQA